MAGTEGIEEIDESNTQEKNDMILECAEENREGKKPKPFCDQDTTDERHEALRRR